MRTFAALRWIGYVVEKKEEGSSLTLLTTKVFIACVCVFGRLGAANSPLQLPAALWCG